MMSEPGSSIVVTGRLTGEGVECQAMRSLDDNTLYTLVGNLGGFSTGNVVKVTGQKQETSHCMQGITLVIVKITKA